MRIEEINTTKDLLVDLEKKATDAGYIADVDLVQEITEARQGREDTGKSKIFVQFTLLKAAPDAGK